jgi:hypothetical protein
VAAITVATAIHDLRVAIEFGQLRSQQAPGGHPLFLAIDRAQEALDSLEENTGIIPDPILDGTAIHRKYDEVYNGIYEASGTLFNDPTRPPPATIWPQIQTLPWPWIAAGVGGLVLVAVLFQRGR